MRKVPIAELLDKEKVLFITLIGICSRCHEPLYEAKELPDTIVTNCICDGTETYIA